MPRILIVDDEALIRKSLTRVLAGRGFESVTAGDAREALALLERDEVDVALVDVKLPGMDGIELLGRIKANWPQVDVIIITGYASMDTAIKALKSGAYDFLCKPINDDQLIAALHRCLEKRRLETESRRMERALRASEASFRAIAKEKEVARMKSDFIATASHELRTPLTSIRNAVDVVLNKTAGEINDAQERFLQMARRNIDRMGALVSELLSLSRIEAGKLPLHCAPLSLGETLENVLGIFGSAAGGKSISLKLGLESGLPEVHADGTRLEQVLVNLLDNAMKYTPHYGAITVTAARAKSGLPEEDGSANFVELAVANSGPGIAETHLPHLFDKFYQADAPTMPGADHGTGLGLAICKGLVEAHGGRIWCESKQGEGCTFRFLLPIVRQAPGPAAPGPTQRSADSRTGHASEAHAPQPAARVRCRVEE